MALPELLKNLFTLGSITPTLNIYGTGLSLTPLGLKIKGHVQTMGHAQSTQPNIPTSSNQPVTTVTLNQPNSSMQFFTGSMKHAQRTPLSEHAHRTY